MSEFLSQALFYLLAATALAGAFTVVRTRDLMSLTMGLGAFLLSVAGYYLFYGVTFLAIGQVFVYVGGVLVLAVITIMTVRRNADVEPVMQSRRTAGAAVVSAAVFALLVFSLAGSVPSTAAPIDGTGVEALGDVLLGAMLPHFEIIGGLLLAALVAVIAITGGERE